MHIRIRCDLLDIHSAIGDLGGSERLAAHIDIGVDENDAELSAVDGRAMACYRAARTQVRRAMVERTGH